MAGFITEDELIDMGFEPSTLLEYYSTSNFGDAVSDRDRVVAIESEEVENNLKILPVCGPVTFPGVPMVIELTKEELQFYRESYINREMVIFAIPCSQIPEAAHDPSLQDKSLTDYLNIGTAGFVLGVDEDELGQFKACILPGPRVRVIPNIPAPEAEHFSDKPHIADFIGFKFSQPAQRDIKKFSNLVDSICDKLIACLSILDGIKSERILNNLKKLKPEHRLMQMAAMAPLSSFTKYSLLSQEKMMNLATMLDTSIEESFDRIRVMKEVRARMLEQVSDNNRENYLRNQLQAIKNELGDTDDDLSDIKELEALADKKNWKPEVRAHFDKELKKLERYNLTMPEYSIQYNYLEMLLNLPWDNLNNKEFSLKEVREALNEDHFGLEKVKERIVEYMAVQKLRGDMKAPILCLVGPPGVGKTSLGKSIARSVGREYHRIALGGVSDEAEIRGHRRTYVGSMAGRIMTALSKSKEANPLIVLDEIDKIGKGLRGDPAQALLEVLDPEQNNAFHDNYVDVDYDLSKVFFIATANSLESISEPLLDRMELIELSGYIREEKIEIALKHLLPKALINNGFSKDEITLTREGAAKIIDSYTRESGVRQLEKKINSILRKIAILKVEGEDYPTVIGEEETKQFLGKEEVFREAYEDNSFAGVVTGLAWTAAGGEILFIETSVTKGKGEKLVLTGNLGDVMKESAAIALEYVRSHSTELGIDQDVIKTADIHIHVPEGAVPKDGPSAGVTMATSIVSALTRRKVRDKLAMTGEITLRGKVLPVGGIKEKILAARRAGIKEIMLSVQNEKDVQEIPEQYLTGLKFHFVERLQEVLDYALLDEKADR